MSVSATSLPPGAIPYINSHIQCLLWQGYTIKQVVLEIQGMPFFEEKGRLVCCQKCVQETTYNFFTSTAFDSSAHFAELTEAFQACRKLLLKKGSFAKLSCTVTIKGSQAKKEDETALDIWTKTLKFTIEGYLEKNNWKQALFGSFPTSLYPKNPFLSSGSRQI